MSTAWVAGSVRARALTRRRLGLAGCRALAASPSLEVALTGLAGTPYGHDVQVGHSLAEAEHAVGATLLWHLRVLAGWLPRGGAGTLRLVAAGFEIANVDEHLRRIEGRENDAYGAVAPYRLGTLATAWPRLAATGSLAELRDVLSASAWGDPGEPSGRAVRLAMRLSWAGRLAAAVPAAQTWAAAATVLLVARVLPLSARRLPANLDWAATALIGRPAVEARSLRELAEQLPRPLHWVLADVPTAGPDTGAELWRAESTWWRHVESDGFSLLHRSGLGPDVPLGAAAVLAADAWRVRAALELAARGGAPLEVFDAVA
ncbi:MAG: hypothetical protein ACXV4A_04660 [Actinomycetes bacterium]